MAFHFPEAMQHPDLKSRTNHALTYYKHPNITIISSKKHSAHSKLKWTTSPFPPLPQSNPWNMEIQSFTTPSLSVESLQARFSMTTNKISNSSIKPLVLSCVAACDCKFDAFAVYLHPTITTFSQLEAYLEPSRKSAMELFCQNT